MTEIKKTFKSITTDGRNLEVIDTMDLLQLEIEDVNVDSYNTTSLMINLDKQEAPAIALAILVGSGIVPRMTNMAIVGTVEHLEATAYALRTYVEANDAEAKAAKVREELLAKKLDKGRRLYNASRSACDLIWEDLSPASKHVWVKRMDDAAKILDRINEVNNS